jgi:hypothetical protein
MGVTPWFVFPHDGVATIDQNAQKIPPTVANQSIVAARFLALIGLGSLHVHA